MKTYLADGPVALPAALVPGSAAGIRLAAAVPSAPRVYQVSVQHEWILVNVSSGIEGTNGFAVQDIPAGTKGMDVRGVPPRGRPV